MMRRLRMLIVASAVGAALVAATPVAEAAASLSEARELYAAAAYADALTMLDGLLRGAQPRDDRQGIELYRVLCLVALGRRADADRAVDAMIERDPMYRPTSDDIPPRLRATFTDARKRLLPSLVQQDYSTAKGFFDRKEFGPAAEGFTRVLKVLADPDLATATTQPPLSDLKTLAEGFRDLSSKAAVAPSGASANRAGGTAVRVDGHVYGSDDRRVVPPVVIKQRVPPFRGKVTGPAEGVIEVVIDARGAVESARMTVPLNSQYDPLVVSAAKGWQYQPATFDGMPVRFRKQVRVTLVVSRPER